MERAHERYRGGYPEEALRLASVAFELEKSGQAVYRRGEERPSDYITWLQSVSAVRNGTPPQIRPQATSHQQPTNALQPATSISATGAETFGRRRTGDVIRADAGSTFPSTVERAVETAAATRSNTGVDLTAPAAPRFTGIDQPNLQGGANSGQVEVPVPPQPRSADATLAMANGGGPSLDAPTFTEETSPVAASDRHGDRTIDVAAPADAAHDKPAEKSSTAVVASDDLRVVTDAFAESETPGLIQGRTTQLTIASLVGLITGVAGMFGLSWWRRQERQHYAAGK
jgi:hypothetical protein